MKWCSKVLKRNKLLSKGLRNVLEDRNGNEVLRFCQKPFDFFDSDKETDKEK